MVTYALINWQSSTVHVAEMKGMKRPVDDITESFAEAAEALRRDERESLEEWADQDIIDIALNHIGAQALFTDEFLREYTEFDSKYEFEDALPVYLDDVTDIEELSDEVSDTPNTLSLSRWRN